MTFKKIIIKNMRENSRKYFFCFFVHAFVICILFLVGSILFNSRLNADAAMRTIQPTIAFSAIAMAAVSLIFLCFVWVKFISSRRAEWGFYLTLGMSIKDLQKIIAIEGRIISVLATATGMIVGFFLMIPLFLWLALMLDSALFYVSFHSVIFIVGAAVAIFFAQQLSVRQIIYGLSFIEAEKRTLSSRIIKHWSWLNQLDAFRLYGFKLGASGSLVCCASLIIAMGVFFIGTGIHTTSYDHENVYDFLPYHFMVESRGDINRVSHDELRDIVRTAGGEISDIRSLPYLDVDVFRHYGPPPIIFHHLEEQSFLVNAQAFSRFVDEDFSVERGELLVVTNHREAYARGAYFESNLRGDWPGMQFSGADTRVVFRPFANAHGNRSFLPHHAHVINTNTWVELAASSEIHELTVFNLSRGDHARVMNALIVALSVRNNLPAGIWNNSAEFALSRRDDVSLLRPISQAEPQDIHFRADSILQVFSVFSGLYFLLVAGLILYCSFAAGELKRARDVAVRVSVGLPLRECKKYLVIYSVLFFGLPFVVGGVVGVVGVLWGL